MNNMKTKHFFLATLSILLGVGLSIYFVININSFSDGSNATDIIGQYDGRTYPGLVPDYTKNGVNNSTDALGLYGPRTQITDEVNHRLFVADTQNNRILVFNLTVGNLLQDHIADHVLGQNNFRSNISDLTQNSLNSPYGLAYDSNNDRLFVSDYFNNRVMVFDTTTVVDGENAVNVLGQSDFVSGNSATTQSNLFSPYGLSYDVTNDYLYVADSGNHRIMVFDTTTIVDGENAIDVLGQYDQESTSDPVSIYRTSRMNDSPNRLGFSLSSSSYNDLVVDEVNHRLFITDTGNNRVLVYNLTSGNLLEDRIADHVLGQNNFYENISATTVNNLSNPQGLAFDSTDNLLFVSDVGNNRVLVFDVASITNGENAVNVLGQSDFVSVNNGTTQNTFALPRRLAFNNANNSLFVADDGGNRVLVFDTTTIIDGENAVNVLGQADFVNNSPTTTISGLWNPIDVDVDPSDDRLFVVDSTNNRIIVYDITAIVDGEDAVSVIGQNDFVSQGSGLTQNTFNVPISLVFSNVSGQNRLFVNDSNNNRVMVFDTTAITNGENAVNVLGANNFTTGTGGTSQSLILPSYGGLAFDSTNNYVYLGDSINERVLVFDVASITNGENAIDLLGQYNEVSLVNPAVTYTTARTNNAPNRVGLSLPTSIAIDEINHRLFISDNNNNRVLVYDLDVDNTILDRVPDRVLGQNNFYESTSGTTQSTFTNPEALFFDATNNRLFVSDYGNNRVMIFDTTAITNGENAVNVIGQSLFTTGSADLTQSGFTSTLGIAFSDSSDTLFVADNGNHRIMIFDVSGITNGENAIDALGQYNEEGDYTDLIPIYTTNRANNSPNRIGFYTPLGQAIDYVHHRLFISDSGNNRVLVYDLTSNDLLIDYIPEYVLGQENFYSNDNYTDQDSLRYPMGLAYDPVNDRLYVTERDNSRITVFDTASIVNGENAIYVLGQPDFTTNTSATTASKMYAPHYIDYDSVNNRLFVGDTHNRRVLIFDTTAITNGENAVNVIGQSLFTTAQIATTQSRFNLVTGVVYDSVNNRLFVGDYNNHRVMVFDTTTITDGENAINVLGQSNFTSNSNALDQDSFYTRVFGLAYDFTNQRLFATDTDANRILVFDVAEITNGENAVNVIGQGNFTSDNYGTSQSAITSPLGIFYDNTNTRLYLGEYDSNNRVMVFDVSETVGGGGGGGGGGGQQPGINVVHTDGGTMVSENTTDTFTISLKSNITSDVVLSITSSNTNEGIVSPATITFSNNNWNTPQTITLTGISDGVVDGNKNYNIVISVIDELSANNYDGIDDTIFSASTTDSDTSNPNIPPNTPDNPIPTPPTNPPNTPSGNPSVPNTPTTPNNNPTTPNGGSGNNPSNPNTPPNNPNIPSGNNPNQNPNNNPSSENQNENSGVNTGKGIFEIISDILGSAITKTLVILGATSTIALNLVRLVFTNPLGITDLAMRAWSMFLYGFGIKKRHKPWGVVFDSQTKQPLDPVYLKLVDIEKKTLATCFTDIDGRYGFLVEPGHYHIIAEKTHYVFPSSKLNSRDRDEVYTDLYYGNYIEIKEFGEVISKNIPMDRVGFDWNEYAKLEQHRLRWYKRSDKAVGQIVDIFFLVGFIVSGITLLGSQIKDYNVIIFALYGILFAFNHTEFGNNAKGKAMFKIGAPIAYGILRVFSKQSGTEITHKIIDRLGNYFCLAPNGNYNISIEQKNADGSYTKVHSEEGIQITKGYLKKDFKV